MSSAVSLNAITSILGGNGLAQAPGLVPQLSTDQSKPALVSFANAYINTGIASNVTSNLVTQLNTIGSAITSGHFLLDLYPSNVTPVSSAGITAWTPGLTLPVGSLFSASGKVYKVTGNISSGSFNGNVLRNSKLAGVSTILGVQSGLPFSGGMSGFANVFQRAYGYSQQVLDTVSSITMLTGRTYNQSGIGYTGPADLVTGGVTQGNLLANVVSHWGTMYDINNITKISDPYVFGQNLLNQGFGYINGLADQLTAVGLDVTDLTNVTAVKTVTTQEERMSTVSTFVGDIEFPTLVEVTTTTPVTGNSPTVVLNIYKTVTGANLATIVNSANISTTTGNITTLADYLDFNKVVDTNLLSALSSLGITSLDTLSQYLSSKVGNGNFRSWADMSTFLRSFETPALSYLPTGANANVLYANTLTTLNSIYGTGSGALGNPIIIDYLGACAGDPYTARFANINANYNSLVTTVTTTTASLDKAVIDYCTAYLAYEADFYSNVPVGLPAPSISSVTANVAAVNSALSSIPSNSLVTYLNSEWYTVLNRLTTEVSNLQKAGVTSFAATTTTSLLGFAERIGRVASNKTESETYQFFANIITNDFYGDTIRATVAENINEKLLSSVGITTFNDPDPRAKIYQAQQQNIQLSTYITRNK